MAEASTPAAARPIGLLVAFRNGFADGACERSSTPFVLSPPDDALRHAYSAGYAAGTEALLDATAAFLAGLDVAGPREDSGAAGAAGEKLGPTGAPMPPEPVAKGEPSERERGAPTGPAAPRESEAPVAYSRWEW